MKPKVILIPFLSDIIMVQLRNHAQEYGELLLHVIQHEVRRH